MTVNKEQPGEEKKPEVQQLTQEQLAAATNAPLYKFSPQAYTELGNYLVKRPLKEVKGIYTAFFRHGIKDPFYKLDAVNRLMEYLLTCPMNEVEGLVNLLESGGGLIEYRPAPAQAKEGEQQQNEQANGSETTLAQTEEVKA